MIFAPSTDIPVVQQFLASGVAGTGLTVTAALYKDGVLVGGHGADATTEIGATGLYLYTISNTLTAVDGVYTVEFITTGTADQKRIAQTVQVSSVLTTIETSVGDDVAADVDEVATAVSQLPGAEERDMTRFTPVGAHHSDALGSTFDTFATPARASGVWLQVTVHNAYYTIDGSTPTTTNGFVLVDSAKPIFLSLRAGSSIKVLRASSGAYLQRQYVREKANFEA